MNRTVLIVEDVETCSAILEIAFARVQGLSVHAVPSAEAALQYLTGYAVDAMITDIHLPSMDGFELIEHVRKDARYAKLPILVISGDSDAGTPRRLEILGADAYFPKPYSPTQVRQKLEQLLDGI